MINEEYFSNFSKKLNEVFGKDTFTEDELTKEFYVDLYIKCNEFFQTDDGYVNLDWFWSDDIKKFLISTKPLIESKDEYEKAKKDCITAIKSLQKLTPEQRRCLVQEALSSQLAMQVFNFFPHYFE